MNLPWNKTEKLVQELAWRDYWQQVWVAKKELIFSDLKQKQLDVDDYLISKAVKAKTGIRSIDHAIG
ncbi:MAG: deoxyribodipyrimidine photolyase, partial [Bacteroidia bacterium]|nr:deoxyribodipyrimidine photolyase [Bacteroidia bacterium]